VFAADRGLPVCECVACCAHVLLLLLMMRLIACLKRASDRPGSLSGKWPHYRSSITINRARRQKMAHPQDRPEPRPAYKKETFCRFRDVLRISFDARKTIAALVGGSSCCLTAQLHYNTVHLMTPERRQMPITRYV